MRIVGGKHRGRPLAVPEGKAVRPTSDRARQALFNILEHGPFAAEGSPLRERRVLDAFAGTGALGLEALSRGAAHAVFLENAPASLAVLHTNIAKLGESARTTVCRADASAPGRALVPCDLILLDPPYGAGLGAPALAALQRQGWFNPQALIVLETACREEFTAPPPFTLVQERVYGAARLIFLRVGMGRE